MVPQVGVIEELAWVKNRVKTIYEMAEALKNSRYLLVFLGMTAEGFI